MSSGVYFDGMSTERHLVEVRPGGDLVIVAGGTELQSWPYTAIRRADGPANVLRLKCVQGSGLARLHITDPQLAALIVSLCPGIDADAAGARQTWRVIGWSFAAIISIILSVVFVVPYAVEKATPYVPLAFDRWLGRVVEPQLLLLFDSKECAEGEGSARYRALVQRLAAAGGVGQEVTAGIIDAPIVNAFALPGGRIFISHGLLRDVRNVDELAGVIAHELGHVHHRHQVRAMIHHGGVAFLIGLLLGDPGTGAIIIAARTALNAAYSREKESAADEFARQTMAKLGRSALPLGEFLARASQSGAGVLHLFDSHPLGEERRASLAQTPEPALGPPLLDGQAWHIVKSACRS